MRWLGQILWLGCAVASSSSRLRCRGVHGTQDTAWGRVCHESARTGETAWPSGALRLRGGGRAYKERKDAGAHNRREMFKAAAEGDVARLRLYLTRSRVLPNARDNDKWTAVHWAAFNNHPAVIVELKKHGANISAVDSFGASPLHFAASSGHQAAIRALCSAGASLHTRDNNKRTPIGVAVSFQQEWAAEYLKRTLIRKWLPLPLSVQKTWRRRMEKDRLTEPEIERLSQACKPRRAVAILLGRPLDDVSRKMLL